MRAFPDIVLSVCEPEVYGRPVKPWVLTTDTLDPTPIFDPFGLRRAVVPILTVQSDRSLKGLGTGFVLDPWNRILTAQHVVEKASDNDRLGIITLHSYGVIFGTVAIPDSAFGKIEWTFALSVEDQNPLATIQGHDGSTSFDLAVGRLTSSHDSKLISNLPIRAHTYGCVKKGDHLVALGFPYIDLSNDGGRSTTVENDTIYAARGIVVDTHGVGRGRSRPTPVIEVECNWPSGMSGGPVFNQRGEVVGVVSSSIDAAEGDRAGRGFATWLEVFPLLEKFLPSIDGLNPHCRNCWGGFDGDELMEKADLTGVAPI